MRTTDVVEVVSFSEQLQAVAVFATQELPEPPGFIDVVAVRENVADRIDSGCSPAPNELQGSKHVLHRGVHFLHLDTQVGMREAELHQDGSQGDARQSVVTPPQEGGSSSSSAKG